jgi:hypothetical protein
MEEQVYRFMLAFMRNCGVAIAISVFFAAARAPSHPTRTGAVNTLAVVAASYPECDPPSGRAGRLVDTRHRTSAEAQ